MKILITGGAGYIGSVLTPMLLADGHHVTVLDNFLFGQNSLLDCCANPRFSVVRGDCRDEGLLSRAMAGKDVIIPLAALVGAPLCDADQVGARTINVDAVKLLLELRSPEQVVLFPNTNSGYGIGDKGKLCTEDSPLRPLTLYGRSKVEAESAIMAAGNAICFRLATVFGMSPRMRMDLLVNDFVYRALTDRTVVIFQGNFKRNYIHVRDVARVFMHGIANFSSMKSQVYNVGLDDANLSKVELCDKIRTHLPHFVALEAPIGEDPDKRDYIVSNVKLLDTGYSPQYSLDDGIQELIKGFTILRNTRYSNV
ncbi:MAG: NAD(P)-dependent oxidoreductase [Candidatus Latescibacteria bacterium]|nr:NAD(P)-dependent oxidoreductase [Candidatus Latescibacterota bacterium]